MDETWTEFENLTTRLQADAHPPADTPTVIVCRVRLATVVWACAVALAYQLGRRRA